MMLGRWEISCNALWHISTPVSQSYAFGILTFRVFSDQFATIWDNSSFDHHIPPISKRLGKNNESCDQADSWENDRSISQGLVNQARSRPFGPFKVTLKLLSIGTSRCPLVYDMACHLPVKLEQQPLWTMKLLNRDASLPALERKYKITRVGALQVPCIQKWTIIQGER